MPPKPMITISALTTYQGILGDLLLYSWDCRYGLVTLEGTEPISFSTLQDQRRGALLYNEGGSPCSLGNGSYPAISTANGGAMAQAIGLGGLNTFSRPYFLMMNRWNSSAGVFVFAISDTDDHTVMTLEAEEGTNLKVGMENSAYASAPFSFTGTHIVEGWANGVNVMMSIDGVDTTGDAYAAGIDDVASRIGVGARAYDGAGSTDISMSVLLVCSAAPDVSYRNALRELITSEFAF